MQDVCISFWKNDGSSDMMLKVTDICSTDPNDPAHCASPTDIKVDRGKAMVMEGLIKPLDPMQHPELSGNGFPDQIWWFFMKCWDDVRLQASFFRSPRFLVDLADNTRLQGLVQPAYSDNWFATPSLPNNLQWAQKTAQQQYDNNQASYPGKGWDTYPNGGYVGSAMQPEGDGKTSPPITDWSAGDKTPEWSPVAGGEGWGNGQYPTIASSKKYQRLTHTHHSYHTRGLVGPRQCDDYCSPTYATPGFVRRPRNLYHARGSKQRDSRCFPAYIAPGPLQPPREHIFHFCCFFCCQ